VKIILDPISQDRGMTATDGLRFLKWNNDVVGFIKESNDVTFTQPKYNEVVELYTKGNTEWSSEMFKQFLEERIVSRDRRDIERLLFRMGLNAYDVFRIAQTTRGLHPKDLLWIANSQGERMDDAMTDVFSSVFRQKIDVKGESVITPEGFNIKRYGVFNGRYGIYKKRINPLVTDAESEVAVFLLGEKLGVSMCPVYWADKDTVFSVFTYDFSKEYVVHFRRLFDDSPRSGNELENLIGLRPQYKADIAKMVLLDFITRQDDRHLSNMAVKISGAGESFYPLYDNGRSLFYEDTQEMVQSAVNDPQFYSTSFGPIGTYWEHVQEIAKDRGGLAGLLNLSISRDCIAEILTASGFTGYRFSGAMEWISKTIGMVMSLQ
jgi:hypothetical protein